jgi:hypothetical protein
LAAPHLVADLSPGTSREEQAFPRGNFAGKRYDGESLILRQSGSPLEAKEIR